MTTEAEIRVMWPQAKEAKKTLEMWERFSYGDS